MSQIIPSTSAFVRTFSVQSVRVLLSAVLILVGVGGGAARAQSYDAQSPDGSLVVTVDANGSKLMYAIERDGRLLVEPSPISMTLGDGTVLGANPQVQDVGRRRVDRVLRPVVAEKNGEIHDRFRELRLDFEADFALVVRVYDDGPAYRFETKRADSITVESETATFRLARGDAVGTVPPTFFWARGEDSVITHSESFYQPPLPADSLGGRMSTTPLTVRYGSDGPRIAITESGLRGYAGMFLVGDSTESSGNGPVLHGRFAKAALDEAVEGDDERNTFPTRRADYIARTVGSRSFPWRVLLVAEDDAALLENQLVYKLAPERQLEDTDWIEPGKVAWDWYNALSLFGVEFDAGVNTRTYKHYIDFAAEYGIEYVILDEGWYELGDLMTANEDIDMQELTEYAEERGVGLVLWMSGKPWIDRCNRPSISLKNGAPVASRWTSCSATTGTSWTSSGAPRGRRPNENSSSTSTATTNRRGSGAPIRT